jgi:hypothetical protein
MQVLQPLTLNPECLRFFPRAASYQKTVGAAMLVPPEGAERFRSVAAVRALLQGARYGMEMRAD